MIAGWEIVVILVCLLGEAFFAGMETGVISIHRMRLRHFVRRGTPGAQLIEDYLNNPDRLLGTTLVGTNLSVVVLSVVAASMGARLVGAWGETLSSAVVTLVVLVFCEYLPKSWFHSRPIERTRRFAAVLRASEWVMWPLSRGIIGLTRLLVPGSARSFSSPAPFVTREDLKLLAHEGERDGVLSPRERFMIHRVFELSGKQASQIMVPGDRMTAVTTDTTVDEFCRIARRTLYTRMPVYDPARKAYAGVVNIFSILSVQTADAAKTVAEYVRPPLFVPAAMPVDDILPLMRRSRQPMCLVRNETDEVVGLLTTEDILEEIVGTL